MDKRSNKRLTLGAFCSSLAVITVVSGGPSGTAVAVESDAAQLTFRGKLLDVDGNDASAVVVSLARVKTRSNGLAESIPLAEETTNASGHFAFEVDPSSLRSQDTVELESHPDDGTLPLLFETSVDESAGGDLTLVMPSDALNGVDESGSYVLQPGRGALTTGGAPAASRGRVAATNPTSTVMTAPRAERNLNPTRGSGTGRVTPALERMYPAARVAAAGVDSCPWSPASYGWAALDKYKYPYVPTKYIKTKGKSKQRWTISRSHETTMQLQMSVSGTKYAGGLQGSMKQESTLTMKPKVGNKQQRIVKLKWRYQRFRRYCMPASGTFIAYLNTWKWVPKNPTGGNVKPRTKQTFSCGGNGPKYNDLFGSETSIARSSEQTYRNFFSIGGVELDSFQKDKDEQVFTVIPNKRRPAKLCGNNGAPLYANLVKERSY